jgi:hypothetical protein
MVIKFEKYLNEGWLFRRKKQVETVIQQPELNPEIPEELLLPSIESSDDDIGIWIIKKLRKGIDETQYKTEYILGVKKAGDIKEYWEYNLVKNNKFNELDPYGEENWGTEELPNSFKIYIEKRISFFNINTYRYYLKINDESLDMSVPVILEIIRILEKPKKDRNSERFDRIKREEKEKKDKLRKQLMGEKYKFKKKFH